MVDLNSIKLFRSKLKFAPDTACPGTEGDAPSTGHCAAVAYLFTKVFPGAKMFSLKHQGQSHWFNYLDGWYIDLTGDQYGIPEIMLFSEPPGTTVIERPESDLNEETLNRAKLLGERSSLATT